MHFRWIPIIALAHNLIAQTTEPRAKDSDFPASATFRDMSIGAEPLAHSVPVPGGMLFAENHIVIDVALFGPQGRVVKIAPENFALTLNGKRIPLLGDSTGSVAASMRESVWGSGPHLEASGSVGNAGVILGRRRNETGIPDLDQRNRGPSAPRAPDGQDRSGAPGKPPLDVRVELEKVSLARCECKLPVTGLLYFPFAGKLKSIRTMTLHYAADGQTVDLPLAP